MWIEKIFVFAQVVDIAVLYLLAVLSVLSVAVIIERAFTLRSVLQQSRKVRGRIQSTLQAQSWDDVEILSRDLESLEGKAAYMGLKYVKENGDKGLSEVFNAFSLVEKPKLERFLNFLATIGSNAPYIGLFGTVLGIMKAFNDLATTPDANQQTVMAGISIALLATAAGLFVAIPAVIAYNYFQKQVKLVLSNLTAVKELCLAYAKSKDVAHGKSK
jgi:biopolymer transport protein ExbB